MLIQYHTENFLSIKNEAELNLIASEKIKDHTSHIHYKTHGKSFGLIRAAALYGANAAGKSNVIKSIFFAQRLIVKGSTAFPSISSKWFKLDERCENKPSKFEFVFMIDNEIFTYGFAINRDIIIEEWLFSIPTVKEVKLFVRSSSQSGKTTLDIGPQLAPKGSKDWRYLTEYVARATTPQELFLTIATKTNDIKLKKLNSVINWFKNTLFVIPPMAPFRFLPVLMQKDPSFTRFLSDFLNRIDTGIRNLEVVEEEFELEKSLMMPSEQKQQIINDLSVTNEKDRFLALEGLEGDIVVIKKDDSFFTLKIKASHGNKECNKFDISDESDGTIRIMNLAPALYMAKQQDRVYVVDEIERSMHPLLTNALLEQFLHNESLNRGQLIFSTHESNLLDLSLLRRDEIFFVERDEEQQTQIYSLSDFKIRNDLNVQKGYLMGRFGAIPFLGDLKSLIESE